VRRTPTSTQSEAWDETTGSPGGRRRLDTGVDLSHPDLAPSLWENPGEIAGNGLDDDANGFVDDVVGWDFADGDANPQDLDGHGSHVAGTIAAASEDGVGVAGVCPGCRIMALRFDLDVFSLIAAIDYAIENGADVLNGSFGGRASRTRSGRRSSGPRAQGFCRARGRERQGEPGHVPRVGRRRRRADVPGRVRPAGDRVGRRQQPPRRVRLAPRGADRTGDRDRCAFTNFGHDSVDLAAPGWTC
jgi:hypothetical protein